MKEFTPERIAKLKQKVRVYERVSYNPRWAKILARLQRIDNEPIEDTLIHYRKTAETIALGYKQTWGVDLKG